MGRKRFLVGSATMSMKDETHPERWPSAGVGSLGVEGRTRKRISRDSHQFGEHQLGQGDRNREGVMGTRGDKRALPSQLRMMGRNVTRSVWEQQGKL